MSSTLIGRLQEVCLAQGQPCHLCQHHDWTNGCCYFHNALVPHPTAPLDRP
jgi:hypothetical protein